MTIRQARHDGEPTPTLGPGTHGGEPNPWCKGGIRLTRNVANGIQQDVLSRYAKAEEACGYLIGPAEDPLLCDEVVVLPNLAHRLHQLDPQTYFRDARTFFAFNEKKFDDAVLAGRQQGRPVKVLYHSHLDVGAYFSATDAAILSQGEAPSTEGGVSRLGPGPAWPLAFLVLSVYGTSPQSRARVEDQKLFVWQNGNFVEAEVQQLP